MFFSRPQKKLLTLRRNDADNPFSSYAPFAFELDGFEWPTVEHYYQAMKFTDADYAEQIRLCKTPEEAEKLGKSKKHDKRGDWDKVKVTVMTRASYIKCRTHPEIGHKLMNTGELVITEVSQYDYFWGCGRDTRGTNAFGKLLMDIRDKLREEQAQQQ